VFHLDIAYACNDFQVFLVVLKVFDLDVVKIDRVLHTLQCA
jgi:hypothetical protein